MIWLLKQTNKQTRTSEYTDENTCPDLWTFVARPCVQYYDRLSVLHLQMNIDLSFFVHKSMTKISNQNQVSQGQLELRKPRRDPKVSLILE